MPSRSRRPASVLRGFLSNEATGGPLLMGAAAAAVIIANSPLGDLYHHLFHGMT